MYLTALSKFNDAMVPTAMKDEDLGLIQSQSVVSVNQILRQSHLLLLQAGANYQATFTKMNATNESDRIAPALRSADKYLVGRLRVPLRRVFESDYHFTIILVNAHCSTSDRQRCANSSLTFYLFTSSVRCSTNTR